MTPLRWLANNSDTLEEQLKPMGITMEQNTWRPLVLLGDRNIGFILQGTPTSFYFRSEKAPNHIQGPFAGKHDALLALLLFEGVQWQSLASMMCVEARIRVKAACGRFRVLWKKVKVRGTREKLRVVNHAQNVHVPRRD